MLKCNINPQNIYISIFKFLKLLFSYLVPNKCLVPIGHIHDMEYHYHVTAETDFLNESVKLLKLRIAVQLVPFSLLSSFRASFYK